jgi:photosystem II stability/assembly factor-like uncharacterized protein
MMRRLHVALLIALLALNVPLTLSAQWVRTNGSFGGTITSLASNGTTLYAGTSGGEIYRTTDYGETWVTSNLGMEDDTISALAFNDRYLFAGTMHTGIVYRSTDSGKHWTRVWDKTRDGYDRTINELLITDTTIFVGVMNENSFSDRGVFYSMDSGTTWRHVGAGGGVPQAMEFINGKLYIGMAHNGFALYKDNYWEHKGGVDSWVSAVADVTKGAVMAIATIGREIFIGTTRGVSYVGPSIYNPRIQVCVDAGLADTAITALKAKGSVLFAGTNDGVFRSSDSGRHWTRTSEGLSNTTVRTFALAGPYLFVGTEGGLYRYHDNREH